MKHLFSFLMLFVFVLSMTAQTIVSTTPAPKNVILEEFTGSNCTYCPDGHRIANELMAANPGKVYAINIHTGTYAPTSPANINYTTAFGSAIAGQSALTGYPAGTVNRHAFSSPAPMTAGGTAQSRSNWTNCAGQIMAVTSPVNVAIDASLNEATRELTILVEVYYTSNEVNSTNKVNIAVLQDYVEGPQVGSSYNPDYVIGSNYYHMHMLRDLIFGQWGITIPTTTAGSFWDSSFVYTVPAAYGAIPAELYDLELVAFVSQGNQEILSGSGYRVPYPLDAGVDGIDVPVMSCSAAPFSPEVRLFNGGLTTITSADVNYSIDGAAPSTVSFSGSLAMGDDTILTLPAITSSTSGSHTLEVTVDNVNGSADSLAFNDATSALFVTILTTSTAPVQQDFASATFPPANWLSFDATADGANWSRGSAGHTAAGSAFINFYNIGAGSIDDLILNPVDFSAMSNSSMTFYVAYRQYSSENDKLQVDVSTNCGTTWTTKWVKSGTSLTTGADVTSNWTSPSASEWRKELVDLSAYDGMSDVLIRFRATSGYGNNLFLDDVNIDMALGIDNNENALNLAVYPNPATDLVTIDFTSNSAENANVYVVNSLGEVVLNISSWINTGNNSITLNTTDLGDGIYFLNIQTATGVINSTFVISR